MLVEKTFHTGKYPFRKCWKGWFLFGIIPIFVKQTGAD